MNPLLLKKIFFVCRSPRFLTIAILLLLVAFAGSACKTDKKYPPDAGDPSLMTEMFAGTLIQNGQQVVSLTLVFDVRAMDWTAGQPGYFFFNNGESAGQFLLRSSDPEASDFQLAGRTWRCKLKPPAQCRTYDGSAQNLDPNYDNVLSFGLHIQPNGITGSSPSSTDSFVWTVGKTTPTPPDGSEHFDGSILALGGDLRLGSVKIDPNGLISGGLLNSNGSYEVVFSGYASAQAMGQVPHDAVATLLLMSALHAITAAQLSD